MLTSQRVTRKGAQQLHVYGNHGAKLMVESDNGRLTYAYASAPGCGTWVIGCVHHQTLADLRKRFAWLHAGRHLPILARARAA